MLQSWKDGSNYQPSSERVIDKPLDHLSASNSLLRDALKNKASQGLVRNQGRKLKCRMLELHHRHRSKDPTPFCEKKRPDIHASGLQTPTNIIQNIHSLCLSSQNSCDGQLPNANRCDGIQKMREMFVQRLVCSLESVSLE